MCGLVNWAPRGNPEQKCVKLKYVLSYSPREQTTEGEKEGGRMEGGRMLTQMQSLGFEQI